MLSIVFLICFEQAMKQQRVKLINQIKDDAEQFRKKKAEMAKEMLQLKSKVAFDLSHFHKEHSLVCSRFSSREILI